jgi:hypothetical protein
MTRSGNHGWRLVPSAETKAVAVPSELSFGSKSLMILQSSARLRSIMATSGTLLTVIAIRLATLVVVGLIAKAAAADHLDHETACVPVSTVFSAQTPPAGKTEADGMLRDMLLHD